MYEYGSICLCPYVYVMCCYVLSMIMYMGICMCDGSLAWARKCIEFSTNEKWILTNKIFVLWDFALGVTSWSCVGATSWDYAGATSWGPERCKVPRTAQSATLQDTYFIERKWESLKATKRDFYEFILQYFQKIMAYQPLHYV